MRFRALLTGAMLVGLAAPGVAQILDNKGKDFILGWLRATTDNLVPAIEIHLTSEAPTMVTVEYPVNSPTFTTTVAVNPGDITIVSLPSTLSTGPANSWVADIVANNCVRAFADEEFVAYIISRVTFTSDAALGLPIDTMNNEYIVMDWSGGFNPSEFLVFAAFDDTDVTITPSSAIIGHPAGVPFTVTLDRGEGYLAYATASSTPLTGSIISSDRPVGVTNGVECANIPNTGTFACDHIMEVAQPVQSWGLHVVGTDLPDRPNGALYRILASEDNTTVTQDGGFLATLNRGEFFDTSFLPGSHEFAGDKPIYVGQFMPGQGTPGATTGDPAQGNVIPCEQYLTDYTFSTIGGSQFAANFLQVYAESADVGALTLDGVPIPAGSFTPVGGSGFSAALIPLVEGTHTTSSPNPHGIAVSGLNAFDSYLYPGGALFQFINATGDANAPTCDIVNDASETFATGTTTDDRPSEDTNGNGVLDPGEDLNGNGLIDEDTGIFFVELSGDAANVALVVDPFVPGDGMATFTVSLVQDVLPGTGSVRVTDGAGNVSLCVFELNASIGTTYCNPAVANSTGNPGGIVARGSEIAADEDLQLLAYDLPVGELCLFITSPNQGLVVNPGNHTGNLCVLRTELGRFVRNIGTSDADGVVSMDLNPWIVPTNPAQMILAGQTWNFQGWYADTAAGGSNFTDAVSVTFQ